MKRTAMRTVLKSATCADSDTTCMRIEPEFWDALKVMAREQGVGVRKLAGCLRDGAPPNGATSAVRVAVLNYFRERAEGKSGGTKNGQSGSRETPPGRAGRRSGHSKSGVGSRGGQVNGLQNGSGGGAAVQHLRLPSDKAEDHQDVQPVREE